MNCAVAGRDISQQKVPDAAKRDVMGEDDAHAAEGTSPKYSVKLRLDGGSFVVKTGKVSAKSQISCHITFQSEGMAPFSPRPNQLAKRERREKRVAMVLACGGAHGAAHPGAGTFPTD